MRDGVGFSGSYVWPARNPSVWDPMFDGGRSTVELPHGTGPLDEDLVKWMAPVTFGQLPIEPLCGDMLIQCRHGHPVS